MRLSTHLTSRSFETRNLKVSQTLEEEAKINYNELNFPPPRFAKPSMRVAFQGIRGAYSEVAARAYFGNSCKTVAAETFDDVFDIVTKKRAERGIIPIENSLAGSIHQNYDLLLEHNLHIVGEVHVRIEHALMCHPDATKKDIAFVRSHPQALAQCKKFFGRNPRITPLPFFDTAGAARSIADEQARTIAAIASERSAALYKLKILKKNLENRSHNFTRFLILAKKPWVPKRSVKAKSSIVFSPESNQTGILFQMLGVFYVRNIDLLKIESRPDPRVPFEYLFYLDLAGSPKSRLVADAFAHLREKTKLFRLLGAYPMGKGNFYGAS